MNALEPAYVARDRGPRQCRASISRRSLLAAAVAGTAALTLPRGVCPAALAVLPDATANRRFAVIYQGEKIGAHTVSYSAATAETLISTEIQIEVKIAFFTVFSYKHRSRETWRAGRLVSLASETDEHGETVRVDGAATSEGFRVLSKGGPFIAAADTMTSNSLWSPDVLRQLTVVDAQHGGIIGVSARKVAEEPIVVLGRTVQARRYAFITPYLTGNIWYDAENLWVHGEFERDGAPILYRLEA